VRIGIPTSKHLVTPQGLFYRGVQISPNPRYDWIIFGRLGNDPVTIGFSAFSIPGNLDPKAKKFPQGPTSQNQEK